MLIILELISISPKIIKSKVKAIVNLKVETKKGIIKKMLIIIYLILNILKIKSRKIVSIIIKRINLKKRIM
jgi:hypothetical protein